MLSGASKIASGHGSRPFGKLVVLCDNIFKIKAVLIFYIVNTVLYQKGGRASDFPS